MISIKDELIKKCVEITGYEPHQEEWEPRIKKMLSTVCQGLYKEEDIVTLTDTGIGGNGGAGIVFTTDAICVKDWGNNTKRFIARFKDICYTLIEDESFLGMDFTKLELHMDSGVVYKLSTKLSGMDFDQMQELIDHAMYLQDVAEDQAWMEENGLVDEEQQDEADTPMDESGLDELAMSAQSPSENANGLAE